MALISVASHWSMHSLCCGKFLSALSLGALLTFHLIFSSLWLQGEAVIIVLKWNAVDNRTRYYWQELDEIQIFFLFHFSNTKSIINIFLIYFHWIVFMLQSIQSTVSLNLWPTKEGQLDDVKEILLFALFHNLFQQLWKLLKCPGRNFETCDLTKKRCSCKAGI